MAASVKNELAQHQAILKTSIKKLQELTFYILSASQQKRRDSQAAILRNTAKVKAATNCLLKLDFSFPKGKKANENNELIKAYSDTLHNLDKLAKCLQETSTKVNSEAGLEGILKKNLDNLRMAQSNLKYFDVEMGLTSKDWQDFEDGTPKKVEELDNG